MASKIDLKRNWKTLYMPSAKAPAIVEVPPANYLMIEGSGNPNTAPRFKAAVETLFPLAYSLKFAVKNKKGIDYGVMPLEGLWWNTQNGQLSFTEADKDQWDWTLMILQPQWVDAALFEAQRKDVAKKKQPPLIDEVRFENFHECSAAQILHIGSFATEGPTVRGLHEFALEQGYQLTGKHHEIYLNDFNRTAPEKLKPIIRQPVKKATETEK